MSGFKDKKKLIDDFAGEEFLEGIYNDEVGLFVKGKNSGKAYDEMFESYEKFKEMILIAPYKQKIGRKLVETAKTTGTTEDISAAAWYHARKLFPHFARHMDHYVEAGAEFEDMSLAGMEALYLIIENEEKALGKFEPLREDAYIVATRSYAEDDLSVDSLLDLAFVININNTATINLVPLEVQKVSQRTIESVVDPDSEFSGIFPKKLSRAKVKVPKKMLGIVNTVAVTK